MSPSRHGRPVVHQAVEYVDPKADIKLVAAWGLSVDDPSLQLAKMYAPKSWSGRETWTNANHLGSVLFRDTVKGRVVVGLSGVSDYQTRGVELFDRLSLESLTDGRERIGVSAAVGEVLAPHLSDRGLFIEGDWINLVNCLDVEEARGAFGTDVLTTELSRRAGVVARISDANSTQFERGQSTEHVNGGRIAGAFRELIVALAARGYTWFHVADNFHFAGTRSLRGWDHGPGQQSGYGKYIRLPQAVAQRAEADSAVWLGKSVADVEELDHGLLLVEQTTPDGRVELGFRRRHMDVDIVRFGVERLHSTRLRFRQRGDALPVHDLERETLREGIFAYARRHGARDVVFEYESMLGLGMTTGSRTGAMPPIPVESSGPFLA